MADQQVDMQQKSYSEIFSHFELQSKEQQGKKLSPQEKKQIIQPTNIFKAYKRIQPYIKKTPIEYMTNLSSKYGAKIYFKREDLQLTNSYKLRGIFNRLLTLTTEEKAKGVIVATTGNQGAAVGYACKQLNIKVTIVIPKSINQIKFEHIQKSVGEQAVFKQEGQTMEDAEKFASEFSKKNGQIFISYDQDEVIYGCGTVGKEILDDIPEQKVDYLVYMVSSGTLSSGMGSYFKHISPETVQVGVQAFQKKCPQKKVPISTQKSRSELINSTTNQMFDESQQLDQYRCKHASSLEYLLDALYDVDHGLACSFVTYLFDKEKIVVDPQSAITPSGIEKIQEFIKGKTVVCVLSSSFRNDISVLSEIRLLSDIYQKKLYYLMINFFTKHGAIKQFLLECLSDQDQVTQIEYTRKNNREKGPALVGIECPCQENFNQILKKLLERKIEHRILSPEDQLFKLKV